MSTQLTNPGKDILTPADPIVSVFERLATDPNASVEKIERLMALWERGEAKKAESAFYGAMSDAQRVMRSVVADATNPQTRSRYASYEAIDKALRPIYTDHGFGLSFNTEATDQPDIVRVTCLVMHKGGHAKPYHIDMPADGKGAKGGDVMTKTHAVGAGVSYGMRYLVKMIWNISTSEDDRDGNDPPVKAAPEGFEDWFIDLQSVAQDGHAALKAAWSKSRKDYREYAATARLSSWEAIKATAAKVQA